MPAVQVLDLPSGIRLFLLNSCRSKQKVRRALVLNRNGQHSLTCSARTVIIEANGSIDVLIVNAGYIQQGILEETSPADIQRQFDTNVFGVVSRRTHNVDTSSGLHYNVIDQHSQSLPPAHEEQEKRDDRSTRIHRWMVQHGSCSI